MEHTRSLKRMTWLGALLATNSFAELQPQVADMPQAMDCIVTPHQLVELSSPVRGVIDTMHVQRSDFVQAGQIVAELDADIERATLALAQARAGLDSELQLSEINLTFDQRRQQRFDALYSQSAVSQQNKDEADREVEISRWKRRQAQELKQIRQLELEKAKQQLEQKAITATIDGFVVARFKSPGEYVDDQPILTIAQLDPLNIEAIVPMSLFGQITKGMQADIYLETTGRVPYPATVTLVDRMGDAGSGTFGVRLEIANPDHRIPAGLKCEMKFITTQFADSNSSPAAVEPTGSENM